MYLYHGIQGAVRAIVFNIYFVHNTSFQDNMASLMHRKSPYI